MVEVITSEEFNEFRKSIEERLGAIEGKLNDLIKTVNESNARAKVDLEAAVGDINEKIDVLEESSKGFVDRLRDAIIPRPAEPQNEQEGSNPLEKTEKTLGRVTDVIMRCPNFFDWDWCQVNCPLYQLCDNVSTVQDPTKLSPKNSTERFKEVLKQFLPSL